MVSAVRKSSAIAFDLGPRCLRRFDNRARLSSYRELIALNRRRKDLFGYSAYRCKEYRSGRAVPLVTKLFGFD